MPDVVSTMNGRLEELKLDMVPVETPDLVQDGLVDGVWITGWC